MPNRLFDSDSSHPDFESYEVIWANIIDKEIGRYEKEYSGCIRRIPFEKQAIWEQYKRLNEYCKKNYMENSGDLIDRHKVAACYLIAVAIVSPMRIDYGIIPDTEKHFIANDVLAITVGLSVLRGFVKAEIFTDKNKTDKAKKDLFKPFENGIKIPGNEHINHGSYIVNYANEIYFAVNDGNYNILSIAHELYLLELITKLT